MGLRPHFLILKCEGSNIQIIRPFTVVDTGLTSNIVENDYTAWSATTMYTLADRVMYNHRNYESLAAKKTGTVTFTSVSTAAAFVVNWVAHAQAAGNAIIFTGTVPTGLVAGTVYFVSAVGLTADAFQISATASGASVTNPSGAGNTGTGTITVTASANYNDAPSASPAVWLDIGATNRWKMFDTSVQSQTTGATGTIQVSIALTQVVDTVALINMSGADTATCKLVTVDGKVYDVTVNTIATEGIHNLYSYMFEPITYVTELVFSNIPPYSSGTLTVTLSNATGAPVYCGGCVLGQSLTIGDTEFGMKVGIQDYSVKTQDAFGSYTIVQRAYSKRGSFTVTMESTIVDQVENMLAAYRAIPIVYIGSTKYGSTLLYGFYKSFEIEIGYLDGTSVCSLEVEGLV